MFANSFAAKRQTFLKSSAYNIATNDLNRDGIPDLVVGSYPEPNDYRGIIGVLLGKANGNFQPEVKYPVGYSSSDLSAPFINHIVIADVNGDSWPDVIVSHNDRPDLYGYSRSLLTILLNRGDGTLQPAEALRFQFDSSAKIRAEDAVVGDFNNDGKPDVLVICSDDTRRAFIYFVRNEGDGAFQVIGLQDIGAFMYRAVSGYFDDDANLDLALGTDRGVIFLFGSSNFGFSGFAQRESNLEIFNLVAADFNGDGKPDIAALDSSNSTIRVFLKGQNGYPAVPIVRPLAQSFVNRISSADFNNDGKADLAVIDSQFNRLGILNGNGDGSFQDTAWINDGSIPSDLATADFDRDGKTDLAVSNLDVPPNAQLNVYLNAPNPQRYYNDFDGDGRADVAVFRPSEGNWYVLRSSNQSFFVQQFGLSTDKIVPGNYDDDHKTDLAIFRNGLWFIWQSTTNSLKVEYWGTAGDIPVPGDYDNDGIMDVAVYRPSTGTWYIKLKNNAARVISWGEATDLPAASDYDGDGKVDIAVWRPSNGYWYILNSSNGQIRYQQFGIIGDKPVAGDFDGDGRTDLAVFRPQNGVGIWYILNSSNNQFTSEQFGFADDRPLTGDFSGDSKNDLAVFRPSNSNWYILKSENRNFFSVQFGISTDLPTSGAR